MGRGRNEAGRKNNRQIIGGHQVGGLLLSNARQMVNDSRERLVIVSWYVFQHAEKRVDFLSLVRQP